VLEVGTSQGNGSAHDCRVVHNLCINNGNFSYLHGEGSQFATDIQRFRVQYNTIIEVAEYEGFLFGGDNSGAIIGRNSTYVPQAGIYEMAAIHLPPNGYKGGIMYETLYNEITTDPLARGYSGMSDAEIAADLNTEYRTYNLPTITGDEVFQATDTAEFAALSDHEQSLWLSFCSRATIDAWASSNVAFVQWVFGAGSDTVSNLSDLRREDITRAEELGLPVVSEADVTAAKEWGLL
jgi:hypothetical protein